MNCSVATDATLAGNPASALPISSTTGVPISVLEKQFGARFQSMKGSDEIYATILGAGPGARGIVFGATEDGRLGHVFNVVNQNGVVRFLDGQTGQVANFEQFKVFKLLRTNK
ncbi:toxin glutamine deamidase domain-containing protein [Luteibacter yeojuensis]|uniref:toxin glutamine deamidase domain-containing protein n=1 Tax=Luteibacter yeojuensis TaxID=345309 RepID=UPI003CCE0657